MNAFEFCQTVNVAKWKSMYQHEEQGPPKVTSLEELVGFVHENCQNSVLFEELLYRLVKKRLSLQIASNQETKKLFIGVSHKGIGEEEFASLGIIYVDTETLQKVYRPRKIPKDILRKGRGGIECVREEWFEARQKRLRIHYTDHHEAWFAPAGSLVELVLSYGLRPFATVDIINQLEAGDDYIPHECAKLTLRYAPPNAEGMIAEEIFVRLDRLEKLVKNRVAKKELQSVSLAECH